MTPKLSIIIPCYNSQKTLRSAVESCYSQGFKDEEFEIVMIDDGSKDDTRSLMKEISSERSNIHILYNEKNQGGGAARNIAIATSTGDIIFPLDSDDILPEGTLLRMYNFLKEKKCDGVTIHRSIKFQGTDTNKIDHVDISTYVGEKIPFSSLLSSDRFCPLVITFMYTKDAFLKTGGYPISHGFDTQGFAWRFLAAGLTVWTCPNAEYLHRMNFGESYYLREYNDGKMNYNWRDILLEHYYVFTPNALAFIETFDCSNFTRNLIDELEHMNDILKPHLENILGKEYPAFPRVSSPLVYIRRNSLRGYFLRLQNRIMSILR